ncbi:MarR family winged helix-turn-helix transcriptional regulator [Mycobacterium sp. EPa45]|uniref:MarR family winged helix-turn-helix transcriptional regulator n=1 Tax=Mycobacterium sp. EPa45 TaxID=1545728 RepID=UPI000641E461|nr:MarR family transcriptional regulator [Mycobacterium sp. EPa45]AKK25455.1 MarR family transcriptional regulator [Mycobacterium sp. EPa45]
MTGEVEPRVADLAADLQQVLLKVFMALRRRDASRGTAGDLTLAQVSILVTLLEHGPIRMTELAARERVRTPTTTVAIRRLERLGLVKRCRDKTDLRAVLVEVTQAGMVQHRESLDARHAMLADILAQLTDQERANLCGGLRPLEKLTNVSE